METKRKKVEYTLDAFKDAEYWCYLAFKEFQKAEDEMDILKEHSKDFLALLMSEIKEDVSESERERRARSSEAWVKFRDGQFASIRKRGEWRVKYYSTVRAWDTIQSGLSYRREELRKLGGNGP